MTEAPAVRISSRLAIPLAELRFRASRSGGPGGQHVNTSSTRVELWWNLAQSPSLTGEQRALARERLGSRLTESGALRIVAGGSRSQAQNKQETLTRFRDLLARALTPVKPRKATRPGRAARERRLGEKRRQSERKQERRRPISDE